MQRTNFAATAERRRLWRALAPSLLLAATLLGCSTVYNTQGELPDADDVLKIQPGSYTRNQVSELLGTPSTVGTFNDDTWYYIGRRTESTPFSTTIIDQQVLEVSFDDEGKVKDVKTYGLEDGKMVDPVSKKTPTAGREMTILQELFMNFGRFNTGTEKQKTSGP
jgi:outer membrane protein assembly factor BamE (lipoprotein component of BamABCDE complex)